MKDFDLQAAKRGAAVCTRDGRKVRILCFDSRHSYGARTPILAEFDCGDRDSGSYYTESGEWSSGETYELDLMMRDDDYMERLERGEYGNQIADASKMVAPTVKKELTDSTCKESLPVGLTKREWFAGMAMAGLCASVGANQGAGFIGAWAASIADATIAELEKQGES